MEQIRAEKETQALVDLDLIRDHWLITLRRQVNVYEFYETETEKKAFAAGSIIMNNWKGLEAANLEAETLGIQKLLETWALPENETYVKVLNLKGHLEHLQTASGNFNELFGNRSVTVAEKLVYDAKALRKEMLDNYTNMVEYILITAKNEEDNAMYVKLLDGINNVRHYFADVLARRGGKGGAPTATDVPKEA